MYPDNVELIEKAIELKEASGGWSINGEDVLKALKEVLDILDEVQDALLLMQGAVTSKEAADALKYVASKFDPMEED